MQWDTAFEPLVRYMAARPDYNDNPALLRTTVFALILEHPSGITALEMWDALCELQEELSQVEVHDRVWGSEHTTLVASIKDYERHFADLIRQVMGEVLGACHWVAPSAQA